MADIALHIDDIANRLTLKVMLEAEGHSISENRGTGNLVITDNPEKAIAHVSDVPALVLTTISGVTEAVRVMQKGVYGYILLPFQPGEAPLMVRRALENRPASIAGLPVPSEEEQPVRKLQVVEAEHILNTLRRCKNNQAKAAKLMGIGRNTLWRKLKKIKE